MNDQLQTFARGQIKEGLMQLPERCHDLFKRMYGSLDMDIDEVVNTMPAEKLERAMDQVQTTIVQRAKRSSEVAD